MLIWGVLLISGQIKMPCSVPRDCMGRGLRTFYSASIKTCNQKRGYWRYRIFL